MAVVASDDVVEVVVVGPTGDGVGEDVIGVGAGLPGGVGGPVVTAIGGGVGGVGVTGVGGGVGGVGAIGIGVGADDKGVGDVVGDGVGGTNGVGGGRGMGVGMGVRSGVAGGVGGMNGGRVVVVVIGTVAPKRLASSVNDTRPKLGVQSSPTPSS